MSTIYTIRRVLCAKDLWCLVRASYQGEELVLAGTWPCVPIPGQRFRGTCQNNARGRSLDNITHVNADENAFRKILYDADIQLKQADALLKNGMKKLKPALESGDVKAFKRWKGVGKSTAQNAFQCYRRFKELFSFRQAWFDVYPTLEEKHKPAFDDIMRNNNPETWAEPYAILLGTNKFWGHGDEEELAVRVQFAKIVAHDAGIDRENEYFQRFERALTCFRELNSTGSTWIPNTSESREHWPDDPYIARDGTCSLIRYERAEKMIARRIQDLMHAEIKEPEYKSVDNLDETQSSAVTMALTHPVSILCGGAGVGKTRTVAAIVQNMGGVTLVCAPTGKAASRLREMGIDARTLHSALFMKDLDLVTRLVLDEQSMQDVDVLAALLRRCESLHSVLFVGDPFQLPSIGPGALLRDLIACGKIPTTRLTKIYRQEGGSIVHNANLIRRGNIHITQDDSFRVLPYQIEHVVNHFMRLWDNDNPPVILTPLNKTVTRLNTLIHKRMRKTGPHMDIKFYGYAQPWPIYEGDMMMNIKNTRQGSIYVANGAIGVVTKLDLKEKQITMAFPEGTVLIEDPQKQLRPCYAVTVHKSQGSEYNNVLCVVEPSRLMHRKMLYTAVTRAKQTCVIYESSGALRRAIMSRPPERDTRLQEYINTCFSPTTDSPPPSSPLPTVLKSTPDAPKKESSNTRKRYIPPQEASTAKRRLFSTEPTENSET